MLRQKKCEQICNNIKQQFIESFTIIPFYGPVKYFFF